ncbi:MAG: TRAP transporter small permease [Deltaproteobacteria bacterium]|jgi:TRAP-type C4-dicarboxylate transport system permease small subunit|nr:TRAP transporter small permease [Deltaproteobacteria bacterium]MBT4264451.1 TRAP transporter small permease [Deltaproteobacteria bacterium]MBT4643568.1 TRAP transporter small permease [Deltaproteobacteria bacterium]MBT6611065.1 TRAP transporter small permease [Deltaproteobacteria bacterium]MBT7154251.1 TRAP transporter small permease [Deltaproteobacteria bacterium]
MNVFKEKMAKLLEVISKVNLAVAATITMCIALIGTIDIVSTNIIGKAVPGAFELSEIGLAMMIFLGLAAASRHHEFIGVDILVDRLPKRGQLLCGAFGWMATSAFFTLWTYQMWLLAGKSISISERANGLLPFPIYPAKVIMLIAMLIATFETVRRTIIYLQKAFSGEFITEEES